MIGLIMFTSSLVFGRASPYFGHYLPGFETRELFYAVAGDVWLLTSLFVLGGAFWEKLKSLFQYNAYAMLPDKRTQHYPLSVALCRKYWV